SATTLGSSYNDPVRRAALAGLFAVALAAGLSVAAVASGAQPLSILTTTGTTTTGTTAPLIAAGVTIGGVQVGGMTAADAYDAVGESFSQPLLLVVRSHRLAPEPAQLGALARIGEAVARTNFGPVIVIRRGSNRLHLYRGMQPWRVFPVATGQASYPTPLGRFRVVVKWRNPWWYPPSSRWAQGLKPVPPGPGNPLGTRWMGLSAPGVGIHGTPDAAS